MIEMIKFPNTIDIDYGEEIDLKEIFSELFSKKCTHTDHFKGNKVCKERIKVKITALRQVMYGIPFADLPSYELQEVEMENIAGLPAKEKHFWRFSLSTFEEEKTIKLERDDRYGEGRFSMRFIDHVVESSGYLIIEQYQWRLIDRIFGKHVKL